jgi:hypothetical protein
VEAELYEIGGKMALGRIYGPCSNYFVLVAAGIGLRNTLPFPLWAQMADPLRFHDLDLMDCFSEPWGELNYLRWRR